MRKREFILFAIFFCCSLGVCLAELVIRAPEMPRVEPFSKDDRVLILAPHPDDEVIGCSGVIQHAQKAHATVEIAYMTNGDHNEFAFIVYEKRLTFRRGEFIHMGQIRRNEAACSSKLFGVKQNSLIFLGYPDFGLFPLFSKYWKTEKPYMSLLTRISAVPYRDNFSYDSSYIAENVLRDLKKVLLTYRPTRIFVTHPADTNGDHRATYLFLQVALLDLKGSIPEPKVYPYLVHCEGWPKPRYFHPELSLEPPREFAGTNIRWHKLDLTEEEVYLKHKAILCHSTQTQTSAFYLLSFARKNELFGDFPPIQLKRQVSVKEKGLLFFQSTGMVAQNHEKALEGERTRIDPKGWISCTIADNELLVRIEKDSPISRGFSTLLFLFGYNKATPFADMPKIRIETKYNKLHILDGAKPVSPQGARIEVDSNVWLLRVPLSLLGNPDTIFSFIKPYRAELPENTLGFRKIVID